jgi:hypothetical protein
MLLVADGNFLVWKISKDRTAGGSPFHCAYCVLSMKEHLRCKLKNASLLTKHLNALPSNGRMQQSRYSLCIDHLKHSGNYTYRFL